MTRDGTLGNATTNGCAHAPGLMKKHVLNVPANASTTPFDSNTRIGIGLSSTSTPRIKNNDFPGSKVGTLARSWEASSAEIATTLAPLNASIAASIFPGITRQKE